MRSTISELVGLSLVLAGLWIINPATLLVLFGAGLIAFGYRRGRTDK